MAIRELISITSVVLMLLVGIYASWPLVIYILTTNYHWISLMYLLFYVLGKWST